MNFFATESLDIGRTNRAFHLSLGIFRTEEEELQFCCPFGRTAVEEMRSNSVCNSRGPKGSW